jgi:Predicted membrane protein (DUF2157)
MPEERGQRDAQQRADRLRVFRQELAELEREQVLVLTEEQRSRIEPFLDKRLQDLALQYDIDVNSSQKQLSLGMRIISALGGLALCAAFFLFFYRFWGVIPTMGQVTILIAIPLLGLVGMHFTSKYERTLYFTGLIGLVVFASFVLNLVVLGQIFNRISSPNAFLAWGALALALGYTYGLRLLLAAGLISWLTFFSATIVSWSGAWWESFFSRPECILVGGALMIGIPIGLRHRKHEDFPGTYRLVGLLAIFLSLLTLWYVGTDSFLPFEPKSIERVYQVIAFITAALTIWAGIRHNLSGTVNLGAAFFTIFLYAKFVDWWWDWMPKYVFFFVIGAIAIGLLIAFRKVRSAVT